MSTAAALLALAGAGGIVWAAPDAQVWVADPLVKVFEDAQPPADAPGTVELSACRNEWQAVQLAVRSAEGAGEVSVSCGPLASHTGRNAIPATAIRCAFVGFVPTEEGRWPDPLREDDRVALRPGVTQPIWLDIKVPADAEGQYGGQVALSLDGRALARVPVRLQVAPIRMPDPKDYRFVLDIWQAPTRIARHYGVEAWSPEHWRLLDVYTADLAEHGQDIVTVGRGLFDWRRGADGDFRFDYTLFDRYVEHCARHGIDRGIEYLQMFNGRRETDVSYFDEAQGRTVTWKGFVGAPEYDGPWLAFLRDFARHLRERGWMEKAVVCPTDEPRDSYYGHALADFEHCAKLLKQADPGYKVTVALDSLDSARRLAPVIDRFVFKLRDDVYGRELAQQQLALGKRVEWYICCHPDRPNTFITSDLIDARAIGWQTFAQGLGGLLRWSYTAWPDDPWGNPRGDGRYRAGDLFIVYPGESGPVKTIRWQTLRLGIQDYELLWMLHEAIERAEAAGTDVTRQKRALANTVNAVTGGVDSLLTYTTNPDTLRRARAAVVQAYLEFPGGLKPDGP